MREQQQIKQGAYRNKTKEENPEFKSQLDLESEK